MIKFLLVINMKDKKRNICSAVAAFVGIAMMAFGIYRGELAIVLTKAIKICLECIGIG